VFVEYIGDFPESGGSRQLLHFGTALAWIIHDLSGEKRKDALKG
jgi:hypothetical protein